MVWGGFWVLLPLPPLNCFRKGTRAEREQAGNEEAGGYQWWRAWLCWVSLPILCIVLPLGMHRPWYCPSQGLFSAASLCSCCRNAINNHTHAWKSFQPYVRTFRYTTLLPEVRKLRDSSGSAWHNSEPWLFLSRVKQLYFLLGNNNSSFSASSLMAWDWTNSSVC